MYLNNSTLTWLRSLSYVLAKSNKYSILSLATSCIGRLMADLANIDRCASLLGHRLVLAILCRNLLAFFFGKTHTLLLRNLDTK